MGSRQATAKFCGLIVALSLVLCAILWDDLNLNVALAIFFCVLGTAIVGIEAVCLQKIRCCSLDRKSRSYAISTSVGIIILLVMVDSKFVYDIITHQQFPILGSATFLLFGLPSLLYGRSGRLNTFGRVDLVSDEKQSF